MTHEQGRPEGGFQHQAEASEQPERRYRAFISYSHDDRYWGRWFHRELETFGVPSPIKTRLRKNGPLLKPIFRDDAETASSPDLGAVIREALERSEALIVICSPNSARSQWVDQEIRDYKAMGRSDRIFPVIVDGEPHHPERECFPPSLKLRAGPDGQLTDEPAEPLAVDIRAHGKRDTMLKLVAGLLGVDYDTLKRRDRIRQRMRAIAFFGVATAVLTVYAATVLYQARATGALGSLVLAELARLSSNDAESPELEQDRGATYQRALRFAALAGRDTPLAPRAPNAEPQLARAAHASHAVAVLRGHVDQITGLEFSADGARLASGSLDRTSRIWSVGEAAPAIFLDGKSQSDAVPMTVHDVVKFSPETRLSPDGRWALSFRAEGGLALSDGRSGDALGVLATPRHLEGYDKPKDFVFSPKDALAAFGDDDAVITIWNLETRELAHELRGHEAKSGELGPLGVGHVVWSPDGTRLLTAVSGDVAILWDVATGEQIARMALPGWDTQTVVFLPDGQAAIWRWGDGRVELVAVEGGGVIRAFEPSETAPRGMELTDEDVASMSVIDISEDGRFGLFSFGGPAKMMNADAVTGELGWIRRDGPTDWFVRVAPESGVVAARVGQAAVDLFDFRGEHLARLEGHANDLGEIAFSADGTLVATGDRRGAIRVWRAPPSVEAISLSPQQEALLQRSMSAGEYSIAWDEYAETAGPAQLMRGDQPVLPIALEPDDMPGELAVNAASGRAAIQIKSRTGYSYRIDIVDLAIGETTAQISYAGDDPDGTFEIAKSMHFSDDGSRLALRGDLGVYVWDVVSGAHLADFTLRDGQQPSEVAFAEDGATLYVRYFRLRGEPETVGVWPIPWLAGPGDRAAAGAPTLLDAVCEGKLAGGLQRLTEQDVRGAPVLRDRVGEDVCQPAGLLDQILRLMR